MKRGEVYDARLDPVEGSEQRGSRPIVVVSRDAINESSPIASAAPCTTYREGRRIYPSHVVVKAPEGGLDADSVILGEQVRVLDKKRLLRRRGELTPATMSLLNEAFRIAFDPDWTCACLRAYGHMQDFLGHADPCMTAKYAHVVDRAKKNPALFIPVKVG